MNITFDSMKPDEFEPVSLQKLEGADPKKDPLQVLESCVDVLTELSTITQWDSQQADAKLEALFATHGDDFKTASREYFSANLQGMSVLTSIGPVRMSAKSKGKVHDRMRKTKALAVPRIPEILMHGEVSDFIPLHKERSDNSEGFYEFKKWLEFPDFKIEAMIKVSQDAQGKLLYYLAAAKQKSPDTGSMLGSEPQSAETGLNANKQFDTASSDSSKPKSDDEVNIEILQVVTTATGKVIQEEEIETSGPAIAFGRANNVKTAKGTKIATVFALVEADDLIASHDAMGGKNPKFPQELQPRDRGRESSQAWVQKVAANIDPESLGRTGRADSGAPIVGDDLVVESGNGRTMAIQLAYERDSAGEYRDWLIDESEYFGFTPEQVNAMKKPVLVRVRKTAIDRAAFAVEANQSDMLSFTATERAKSDANRIDDNLIQLFQPSEDGDLLAGTNQKFIQGFLKSLGEAEAAQYITKEGKPTQALIARIKAAVFKKAYNDDRLLEMVADQTKPDLQNMLNALSVAAPKFIESQSVSRANTEDLSSSIVDGIEQAIDQRVVNAIVDAANVVMTAKNNNQDVAEFVKQQGLFGDMPEGVPELAVFIAQNSRSAKKMSVFFKAMADYLEKKAIDSQNHGLFGEPAPLKLADVINFATSKLQSEYGENVNLSMFDSTAVNNKKPGFGRYFNRTDIALAFARSLGLTLEEEDLNKTVRSCLNGVGFLTHLLYKNGWAKEKRINGFMSNGHRKIRFHLNNALDDYYIEITETDESFVAEIGGCLSRTFDEVINIINEYLEDKVGATRTKSEFDSFTNSKSNISAPDYTDSWMNGQIIRWSDLSNKDFKPSMQLPSELQIGDRVSFTLWLPEADKTGIDVVGFIAEITFKLGRVWYGIAIKIAETGFATLIQLPSGTFQRIENNSQQFDSGAGIDMFDSATDPDIGIQLINESNPLRIIELSLTILKGIGGAPIPDNYSFTEKVTRAARQTANNKAVALLRAIQNGDVQSITPEDKQVLSNYTGTGGNLVGEDGLKGSAYEYYTPLPVAQSMWDLLKEQGFNGGSVLDPSSGTGIFAASAPKGVLMQSVELSDISGSINQIVNGDDKHAVTIAPFEQVAHGTQDEIYDAVITNVPFGTNADRGKNKNLDPKYQGDTLEEYFIKRSLDKLRPNGFAAFIVPTKILDNTSFKKFRQIVLLRADLLGAYRLPNKVFDATGADVTTDIIVLRKFSEGIADKINNLYENGGLAILKEAQVLNADIIAGRYFQKMGKQYILGETVKGKGRFGEVERVINDDSLSNILKLVKRFPDSRIDLSLLDATEELEPVTFNEGDIRQVDGATFELKGGEWTQVAKNLSFDEGRFNSPFAMLDGKVAYSELNEYMGFKQSTARTIPDWITVLKGEASIKPESFGYWLCILSIIDALKQKKQAAYAEVYPALTNYMVGYATSFNTKVYKTKNPDYKRFLKLAEIAFDPIMPDGISGYWRGTESEDLNDKPLHARAAYESAIYRGIAENWQVDVDFIRETDSDFSPLANDEYAVNEDGTKVTLSRDYYVGNYASFLNKIDVQIAAATDPGIKEKLLRQKQKAADLIPLVDVKKVQYDLLSTVVPMDLKYRYFSEFIDDSVILDADERLELDEKIETVNDLVKYRLGSSSILSKQKMDESNPYLRHFMLNRIFNSINNNQRLYVKTDETISKEVKTALFRILTDYFNTLNASFDAWLKSNDVFMNQLDIAFNAPENKTFPVELDDSPLVIEGFNPKKEGFQALNGYQNEEIRRLSRNFAGMCGFDVGLGKTLTALAATHNMHNMGVKKRTFFVVPPHTISKWFNDMKMAYDATDDVLVIGSNQGKQDAVDSKFNAGDFALLTKPAGNKYRKILLTVDAFNMIPLREATITKHYEQTEAYQSDRKQDAEKQDGTLSTRIKKINKYESKLPYFEDMAIDSLIFDEAQLFKNGKAGGGNFDRVKGLSLLAESTLSSRAISAAVKAWYVRGQNGELNDGVVLLTATPFTNSPVEILTMLSLAVGDKEALRNLGGASITNVEDFLSTFANVEAIEAENIVGDLTSVDTFTGFKNVHLLKDSIHSIANIQTARERGLKIPDEENVPVAIDIPEDDQAVLNQMKSFYELAKQHVDGGAVLADVQQITAYEAYKAQTGETDEILAHPFNLISRMSDVIVAGAEMGLMRIVPVDFDPQQLALATALADSFNKKNITIKTQRRYPGVDSELITTKALKNNLGELFDQFTIQCRVTVDDNNNRLILNVDDAGVVAQLMELVDQQGLTIRPKISAKVQAMVENFKVEQLTPKHMGFAKQLIFCDALAMQHIIKRALIVYCGLKPGQIAIINAQTLPDGTKGTPDTEHVQEVQDKFASNEFTVVIANKKAETGIDLQIGTQAIHHITTGWTPDSIQQRNGRGVRQGNQQKSLNVYFYNANGTFDEYKQRLIAGKADWIDKLMQKGADVSGTLTISRELSKEDYEDLIKADSPEQIAELLKAKSDREELQRATAVNNKTRLLYDNMIKAKKRPKPTIAGQVRKIMEFDAKKLSELIKKRDKAVKQDVIDRYTKLIQDISNKYDGWFDGYLTAGDVVASIQRELGSRGHKFDSYDIYRRMNAKDANGMRYDPQGWIDRNADTLINDVFNRARNIVSTADNMVAATKESFMNFQDNGYSDEEKQALASGSAVIDAVGVIWFNHDYIKIESADAVGYGFVEVVESSNQSGYTTKMTYSPLSGSTLASPRLITRVEPDERSKAIEYMVASDIAECESSEHFDIDTVKPFYSRSLEEIRNIVAARLVPLGEEWGEKTSKLSARMLLDRNTQRRYWDIVYLPETRELNPEIVNAYNGPFKFESYDIQEGIGYAFVRNKDLKQYSKMFNLNVSGFFDRELSGYLLSNNLQVTFSKNESLDLLDKELSTYMRMLNMARPMEIDLVKPIKESELIPIIERFVNIALHRAVKNLREVTEWYVASESFARIKLHLRIVSDAGDEVTPNLFEYAQKIATQNTRGQMVVGLKSRVDGKFDNPLFENKESLKRVADYAYWSGRKAMWIIDLDSFDSVSNQQWYDSNKIDIVEAQYK